jgi:DNA-binding transcriptional LysR family regulator
MHESVTAWPQPGYAPRLHAPTPLRTGPSDGSSLIARKIAEGGRLICAAPAYLERRGRPAAPNELLSHDCLVLRGLYRLTTSPFRTATGLQTLTVRGVATTDIAEALRDMALAGLGVIRVSVFIAARDILEGQLVPLFQDLHVSEDVLVWAVTAPGGTGCHASKPSWTSWRGMLRSGETRRGGAGRGGARVGLTRRPCRHFRGPPHRLRPA